MKYSLCQNGLPDDKWNALLQKKINEAEYVEFNTLYSPKKLNPELQILIKYLVEEGKRKNKVYPSGKYRRFEFSDEVKNFILSKSYKSWMNYQFEDLSLIKDEIEILATITHEDYIFITANDQEIRKLNEEGYGFSDPFEFTFD